MAGRVLIPTGHDLTPLLVVGCEVDGSVVPAPGQSALYTFDHQFQGTACAQMSIHGAGLLLEHNLERLAWSEAPATALLAMKSLGEHPIARDGWTARERRAVDDWLADSPLVARMPQAWVTDPKAVAAFAAWLRRVVLKDCPAIERYTEALAISQYLPALPPTLADWRVLICHPRCAPEYNFNSGGSIPEQPTPRAALGPTLGEVWSRIETTAVSLSRCDSAPRLYFVWANSD